MAATLGYYQQQFDKCIKCTPIESTVINILVSNYFPQVHHPPHSIYTRNLEQQLSSLTTFPLWHSSRSPDTLTDS
jgi:hypothetical protein